MAQGGHTIGEAACGVSFYNGLPVCACVTLTSAIGPVKIGPVKIYAQNCLQAPAE